MVEPHLAPLVAADQEGVARSRQRPAERARPVDLLARLDLHLDRDEVAHPVRQPEDVARGNGGLPYGGAAHHDLAAPSGRGRFHRPAAIGGDDPGMHRREERGRDDHVGLGRGADRRAARGHRQDPAVPSPGQLKPEQPGRHRRWWWWWWRRRSRKSGRRSWESGRRSWESGRRSWESGRRSWQSGRGAGKRAAELRKRAEEGRGLRRGDSPGQRGNRRRGNVRFRRPWARARCGHDGHRPVAAKTDAIACPEPCAAPLTAPNFAHSPPPWLIVRKQRSVLFHERPPLMRYRQPQLQHSNHRSALTTPQESGGDDRGHGRLDIIIGFYHRGLGIPA